MFYLWGRLNDLADEGIDSLKCGHVHPQLVLRGQRLRPLVHFFLDSKMWKIPKKVETKSFLNFVCLSSLQKQAQRMNGYCEKPPMCTTFSGLQIQGCMRIWVRGNRSKMRKVLNEKMWNNCWYSTFSLKTSKNCHIKF